MKTKTFLILLSFFVVTKVSAQKKEWQNLIRLLQKEAQYFEGKSGFIRLAKSEYNVFTIEKLSINDTMVVSAMWLKDRFENEPSERYLEETVLFYDWESYIIRSAEIFYDYAFYFEGFPEVQFLLLEFDKDIPLIHQVQSIYKDLETGEEAKSELEDTTHQIILPIRNKNREEIFRTIDDYQRETAKVELYHDMHHK